APMRCRILRVIGCGRQRCPAWIRQEFSIAAAGMDSRNGPPEVVGEFRVPASDTDVRVPGPEQCQEPGRVHYVQLVVLGEIRESAAVLLPCMNGPEEADFALR